ncbi:MAG: anthranilate phosphoribosyltransferase [Candidatus Zixiibacteriota bacterium]
MIKEMLARLAEGEHLARLDCESFIRSVAVGDVSDAQVAAFLTGLKAKGETVEEVAGCVLALRASMQRVEHTRTMVFDCCGTGGDGTGSFNFSTAASLIVAACGIPTAKHGNRAVSSSCGSADLFEASGVKIDLTAQQAARLLDDIGYCFLFAPVYHTATKKVAEVRRQLGFRTLFNLIGPLLNPAVATHQMIGTPNSRVASLLAEVSRAVGDNRVFTFYNSCGFDEILPTGLTMVHSSTHSTSKALPLQLPSHLANGNDPHDFQGGDRVHNAAILKGILDGDESPFLQVSLLNAAFGLTVAGLTDNLDEAFRIAHDSVSSGRTRRLFDQYRSATQAIS